MTEPISRTSSARGWYAMENDSGIATFDAARGHQSTPVVPMPVNFFRLDQGGLPVPVEPTDLGRGDQINFARRGEAVSYFKCEGHSEVTGGREERCGPVGFISWPRTEKCFFPIRLTAQRKNGSVVGRETAQAGLKRSATPRQPAFGWSASLLLSALTLSPVTGFAQQVCKAAIPLSTPTSQFLDHGDGTVTDRRTGLTWKRCLEGLSDSGCTVGAVEYFTWQEALEQPSLVNASGGFAGYTDWRVPNINELRSIVEERCVSPALNQSLFPDALGDAVWSSSPTAGTANFSRYVDFAIGNSDSGGRGRNYTALRLVRGPE